MNFNRKILTERLGVYTRMARDEAARDGEPDASQVNRRTYLKAAGVATLASVVSTGSVNGKPPKSSSTEGEIRDLESNLQNYKPEQGAKFFATDTGKVFFGTGKQWEDIATSGTTPTFTSVNVESHLNGVRVANDGAEVREHLNELSGTTGSILLTPGEHVVQETITLHHGVQLHGSRKATSLRLEDGANTDLIHVPSGADWCQIQNLHLKGNKANNSHGSGIRISGQTYGVQVSNLIIDQFAEHGFVTEGSGDALSYEANLDNVQSKENGKTGFTFEYMTDLYASHIYAEENGEEGIVDYTSHNTYWHPHVYGNQDGMRISQYSSHIDLYCPHFENNAKRGCLLKGDNCVLVGGQSYNNNQDDVDAQYGYDALEINDGVGNRIFGGVYYDDQSTPTQRWGINETGVADENQVQSTRTFGNSEGGVRLRGSASTQNGLATESAEAHRPQANHTPGTFVQFTDAKDGSGSGLYLISQSSEPIGPLN